MIDPTEAVQAGERVAKIAERFPWGTTIATLVGTVVLMYFIMHGNQAYDQKRADQCEIRMQTLTDKLLIKNNIIDNQAAAIIVRDEAMAVADSTIRQETRESAAHLLKKPKK